MIMVHGLGGFATSCRWDTVIEGGRECIRISRLDGCGSWMWSRQALSDLVPGEKLGLPGGGWLEGVAEAIGEKRR